MKNQKPSRWMLILAFFAIYFVWGTTYLAGIFALDTLKPFVISCLRYLAAGLILSAWVFFRKIAWPDLKTMKVLSISGIVMLVGGSGLVVYAEQYINSGYAAVVIATEPLWFVVLDKKRWTLYFADFKVIAGLLIGFAGVALFAFFTPEDTSTLLNDKLIGTLLVLLGAVLWVIGTLYAGSKLKEGSSNVVNSSVQLLAAGLFAGILALLCGEWAVFSPAEISAKAWGGLLFLVIMGSLIAYMAFTWLVTVQPPALVSTHTYVNPVVAILIGWLIANEEINYKQVITLFIVLTGVVITQMSIAKSKVAVA